VLYLDDVGLLLRPIQEHPDDYCTPEEVNDLSCEAGFLPDGDFAPRPTGGTVLLEGSVEVRFPITGQVWEGATFLDFGQVWEEDFGVDLRHLQFTPGLGVRYYSPIGPIRVDLAYRFDPGERLQVVTRRLDTTDPGSGLEGPDGPLGWKASDELVLLTPRVLWGDYGTWSIQRFQLHFSIGQAF
jgi:outer membrane protein assembly factor BamA